MRCVVCLAQVYVIYQGFSLCQVCYEVQPTIVEFQPITPAVDGCPNWLRMLEEIDGSSSDQEYNEERVERGLKPIPVAD